jgi:hypothetical protein
MKIPLQTLHRLPTDFSHRTMRTAATGSTSKMKGKNMKTKITIALAALALGASAWIAGAQDNAPGPNSDGPHGPGMRGQRPPVPAIFRALDANHDGVIDADEIANASAVLKTLDKNGDGKITLQEALGPRPPMRGGPNGSPDKHGHRNGPGDDDNNLPPGPPPGADDDGNNPPAGPPPGDN